MKRIGSKFKESRRLRIGSALLLIMLLVGCVFLYLLTMGRIQIEDSIISAPISSLAPSTSGILKEVDVTDGQQVKKGDQLAIVGSETLHAYTDGIIVDTNKQIGGSVNPQTPIIKMINPAQMRIDGTIDENKGMDNVKTGQPVSFTVDALPGTTFWGYIDEVAPTAKQSQAVFTISSERPVQQFDIYAHFDASNHPEIRNGMSAKMTVYTKTP